MDVELRDHPCDVDDAEVIYRVGIWSPPPVAGYAWNFDEWELRGVEGVHEVLSWGRERANDRPFEVFASAHGSGYIRLFGQPRATVGATYVVELTTPD